MLPEGTADTVQSYGVDAGIDEAQTEADHAKCVPESIKLFAGSVLIAVEPEHEDMLREETYGKHYDEGKHHLGDLLPGSDLSCLPLHFSRHVSGTKDEVPCHEKIEERDYYQWDGVVDEEFGDHHGFSINFTPRLWEWIADVDFVVVDYEYLDVRSYSSWQCAYDGQYPDENSR